MLNIGIKSTKIIPMASQNIKRLEKSLLIICADRKLCMSMLMVTGIAIQKPPLSLSLSLSLTKTLIKRQQEKFCKVRVERCKFFNVNDTNSMLMITLKVQDIKGDQDRRQYPRIYLINF